MGKAKTEIVTLLKRFKKKLDKKIKVDGMILFGSRARGEEKNSSDIDLIIISDEFKEQKYFKRSPRFYIMWNHKYDIDILCLTQDEINRKKKQVGIVQEAVREGIEIK